MASRAEMAWAWPGSLAGIWTKLRFSGVDSRPLAKSKRFCTSAESTVWLAARAAALMRTRLSWRTSGRRRAASLAFMKVSSWASVGAGGAPTMAGVITT